MSSQDSATSYRASARDGVAVAGDVNCADFIGRDQNITYGYSAADVERLIEKVLAFLQAGAAFVPEGNVLRAEINGETLLFRPGATQQLARRRDERSYLLSLTVQREYQIWATKFIPLGARLPTPGRAAARRPLAPQRPRRPGPQFRRRQDRGRPPGPHRLWQDPPRHPGRAGRGQDHHPPLPGARPGPAVQAITVQPQICNLATEVEATDANALFGDDLYLLEYQVHRRNRYLQVTLYWRAQRRIDTDYNIFVHIFDPATDQPVAQDDAMPHRWAYPTTFWWPGEVVGDRIPISLGGVPPGSYGIAVGVYDPASGERLPLVNNQGHSIADRRLILEETVRVDNE